MSSTRQQVGIVSLDIVPVVVDDLEAAIDFYTGTLGFEIRMDETFEMQGESGRWVTVGVPGDGVQLSLLPADEPYYGDDTRAMLAEKLGSKMWYTFATADCEASVAALEAAGVEVTQGPTAYPWGTEAMFLDPVGNEFSLFEYAAD